VLHLRDLVQAWSERKTDAPIAEFLRPPFYVPETQTVDDLLDRLRTGTAIALVVDEYGGIAGLVTLEDVLEEIVGDIRDEHDDEEDMMREQPDGSWLLSGLVHVETLEELFGVELEIEDRDFDTVGGLVISVLGRVPLAGEEFLHGALRLRVVEADARRVFQVEVARAAGSEPQHPTATAP
jgi:CBS domain containing-hemolysin-like protein